MIVTLIIFYILGLFVTFGNVIEESDIKSFILSFIFSILWPMWLLIILGVGLYNMIKNIIIKIKKNAER